MKLALLATLVLSLALVVNNVFADDEDHHGNSLVERGFAISPIPEGDLTFDKHDRDRVGFGSFIVNAMGDCSGCHTFPEFLAKGNTAGSNPTAGDPFLGLPSDQPAGEKPLVANFNVSHYLAGGQCFGPFMARNLTPETNGSPENNGLPEGLTEAEFVKVMRTGEDIHCEKEPTDPICALGPPTPVLQVMPWPTYHNMTNEQLKSIYAYLRALPVASACNTVDDGCPGFSGAAVGTPNVYAYPDSASCPNPAPPQ